MKFKSYTEIAKAVGLAICVGPCALTQVIHDRGYLSYYGVMHWRERRVTRTGIKRFLMVAASGHVPDYRDPSWMVLWTRIEWTRSITKEVLRLSLPPTIWAEERARLASLLTTPDKHPNYSEERAKALRWTRRTK